MLPKVTARLMNGTSMTFRLDSTSPVSLLYSLVETWVNNIPKTLQDDTDDTEIVLLKGEDMLEKSMTLADYGLPNGDAEVSVVVQFDMPPSLGSSSSEVEDNKKDEAAASASSASESESSPEVSPMVVFNKMFGSVV
mgnify:FL=1